MVTQLFGERLYIANATGCSSICGGSAPSCAYTVNAQGKGPAWANSLFEDNAEFGFGMMMAQKTLRKRVLEAANDRLREAEGEEKEVLQSYLESWSEGTKNAIAVQKMTAYYEQLENRTVYSRRLCS